MNEKTYDFTETLNDLDAGVFAQKLSRAVADTAEAVAYHERKAKGKVTIELTMERIGDSSQLSVSHKLSFSKPTRRGKATEEDTTSTALYVGPRGALSVMPDTQIDWVSNKENANG